jgi:hypothetical protein
METRSINKKNAKVAGLTTLGLIVALLGMLWVVQGLGIVQIDPILCAGDCEPITGGSVEWAVIGAITLVIGSTVVWAGLRRLNW